MKYSVEAENVFAAAKWLNKMTKNNLLCNLIRNFVIKINSYGRNFKLTGHFRHMLSYV